MATTNTSSNTIDGNVVLPTGEKANRRISKVRRLDEGGMVGYISFQGQKVRVTKGKGKRLWTLLNAA